eukprot:gene20149-22123_t
MDSDSLHLDIDYVASSGVILSIEQKAALQSSLVILKAQQQFEKIQFWGKILGVRMDYFVVQGVGKDQQKDRKTLYSLDCMKWGLLQLPDDETKRRCLLIKGRFMGDPSHEYEYAEKKADVDETEQDDEDNTNMILIKEEDRLATVISAIDLEIAIAPRGAYTRTPTGEIHKNRMFEGLSAAEATRLSSYFHFREPIFLQEKSLLQKADLEKSIDFLDPIDADIPPNGSWSIQFERGNGLVVLRSLHWIGFTFYHVPSTSKYGYVYVGTGEKNLDLPFML